MRALTSQSLSSSTRTKIPANQGQSSVPAAHCASPSAGSRRVAACQTQLQAFPAAQKSSHMQSEQLHRHRLAPASATSPAGQQQQQPDTSFVPLDELRQLCSKALSTIGYTKDETQVLMEVCAASVNETRQPALCFATAPCRGHSQKLASSRNTCIITAAPQHTRFACIYTRQVLHVLIAAHAPHATALATAAAHQGVHSHHP
jgi:hypothetical protein